MGLENMKLIIVHTLLLLALFTIGESCLVTIICEVAEANCNSPCYQCGLCKEKCCQTLFLGREDETNSNRAFLEIDCVAGPAPAAPAATTATTAATTAAA